MVMGHRPGIGTLLAVLAAVLLSAIEIAGTAVPAVPSQTASGTANPLETPVTKAMALGSQAAVPAGLDNHTLLTTPALQETGFPVSNAMGLADDGLGPSGLVAYTTMSFEGTIDILSLLTYNQSVGYWAGFQLNAILGFVDGGQTYYYWLQSVAVVDTSNSSLYVFTDEIWNFTANHASVYPSTLTGNGGASGGYEGTYGYILQQPDGSPFLVYPGCMQLVSHSTSNSLGQPEVHFSYDVGVAYISYDQVTFDFVHNLQYDYGLIVDGSRSDMWGSAYDVELVLGGPGGGSFTTDVYSDVLLSIQFWNGHNYETVNNAINHGLDTGEFMTGTNSTAFRDTTDGMLFARLTAGAETSDVLWRSNEIAFVSLSGPYPIGSGTLDVNGEPTPYMYGAAVVAIGPGTYVVAVTANNITEILGATTVRAGSMTSFNAGQWYTSNFVAQGLPAEELWGVTVDGVLFQSRYFMQSIYLPDGTNPYNFSNVPGWHISGGSYAGIVLVSGASPAPVVVTFAEVTYELTFVGTGFPSGTSWSVTLNGSTKESTGNTIAFTEPNGTYPFTVGTVSGYTASPSSGTVNVRGAAESQLVTFAPVTYTIPVHETGLPAGTSWSVTLSGVTKTSITGTITFAEQNGTYDYTVSSPGYQPSPASGAVIVLGASPPTTTITFTQVTYTVSFSQTGLPTGMSWSMTVDGTTRTSMTAAISFGEPNGSYSYSVTSPGWQPSPGSGNVLVSGASQSVLISFTRVTYTIILTETGLPSGTSWSATLNGATFGSTTSTISFTEPNGTYACSIPSILGYSATYAGQVMVNGASVSEFVTFTQVAYRVTFMESGLPPGTSWTVTLNSVAKSTATASISFTEPDGTYHYMVRAPGWQPSRGSGTVSVSGAAVSQLITFTQVTYAVTFTKSSLPSGTDWSVTLNGDTESSMASSITFNEPNGTYTFTVGSVSGYTVSPPSGQVTVNGVVQSQSISFTSTSTSAASSSFPWTYVIIGVVIAAVVVGLAVALVSRSRRH